MKRLVLIRHAHAAPGSNDHERPLTSRGIAEAKFIGGILCEQQFFPSLMICSTSLRTMTTASIIAQELSFPVSSILPEKKLYNTGEDDYFNVVQAIDDQHDCCYLFGHNFTISNFLWQLTGSHHSEMVPCTAAVLAFDVEHWSAVRPKSALLDGYFQPEAHQ